MRVFRLNPARAAATLAAVAIAILAGCTPPIAEGPVAYTNRLGVRLDELAMTTPRANHAAAELSDGRVLICGGTVNANIGGVLTSAEIFDPATRKFSATGSMTVARMGHTATVLHDGRVLIVGGQRNIGRRTSLASAELYDPATGAFTATAPMTTAREGHTATLLRDGRVLVAGGSPNGTVTTSSAEIYDPTAGNWTPAGHMTVPREAHVAVLLGSGKVLIAGGGRGGMPGGYIAYQNAGIFDPASGKFTAVSSPMRSDRVGAAGVLLDDGRALIVGGKSGKVLYGPSGRNINSFTPLDTAEIFDPETQSFIATQPMREPHYLPTATLLGSGGVLIVGGWRNQGNVILGMTDAEDFTPGVPGSFASVGPLHVARLLNTATIIPEGDVMIAGGIDATGKVSASVEFYSPSEHRFERSGVPAPPEAAAN
ncbi:MAG: Kelch repeat-containing protein [Candidatus Binataceae bacterium]